MTQQTRAGDERARHRGDDQRRGPGGDIDGGDGEVRVGAVGAHRFDGEEEENPDGGAHDGGVGVEEESLGEDVECGGEGGES